MCTPLEEYFPVRDTAAPKTIVSPSTLAKDDVERMVQEAEKNEAADKEKSGQIEIKNQADSMCYQTKKQLDEMADKISSDEIAELTLKCLIEHVPSEVPGIAFLSGGQTEKEATKNLDIINKKNK